MNRRAWLQSTLMAGAGLTLAQAQTKSGGKPVHIFADMDVDPAREKEMVASFHNEFVPEAKKHQGYINVTLMKLQNVFLGPPYSIPYRFEMVFESEELRQKWIKSPGHDRVWGALEKMLKDPKNYPVHLFQEI